MVEYDAAFFADIVAPGAIVAAEAILPDVLRQTGAQRVVDVGCGNGAWASVAAQAGCDVLAVDGYATPELLHKGETYSFSQRDLTDGFDCTGFDLAICLEVGEHLPESSAAALVAGLCKASYVLFGAAIPEQGGVGHVNEQWQTWWADKFTANWYGGSADVRWDNWENTAIEPYYLANPALYTSYQRTQGQTPVTDVVHPRLWSYKVAALKEAIRDL